MTAKAPNSHPSRARHLLQNGAGIIAPESPGPGTDQRSPNDLALVVQLSALSVAQMTAACAGAKRQCFAFLRPIAPLAKSACNSKPAVLTP